VNYQQAADLEKIRGALGKSGFTDFSVQNFGSSQDVMIRLPLCATRTRPSRAKP
jgi:preprotein translocase subunit SecF